MLFRSLGVTSVNTPAIGNMTGGVQSIVVTDGGRFNAPLTVVVGPPPAGGTRATAEVATYVLRAIQGYVAINATDHAGAPDGVTTGMVFALVGGKCSVQPQVTYDGSGFTVTTPGACSMLPAATVPSGSARASLVLSYVSGGTAPPSTLPVVEPLYAIGAVALDTPGSGYNSAVPPDVFAMTQFSNNVWTGTIYTPVKLDATMSAASAQAPIQFAAMMQLAALPANCAPEIGRAHV